MKKRLLSIVFALLMLGALLSFSILAEGPAYDGDNEVPGQEWGNIYAITLPTGTGFTAAAVEGFSSTVNEGDNYSFTVTIADGYEKDDTFAVKANGVTLAEENGVYTITEVIADQVITVEGVKEAEAASLRGDADGNGIVELKDVTRIRLYLAGRIALEDIAGDADADGNGTVELKDVTRIRLYLAGRIALEDM